MGQYSFAYYGASDDGSEFPTSKGVTTNLTFHDATPWDVIHREFVDFLSSIYGYDISKSIDVQTFEQRMAAYNNED